MRLLSVIWVAVFIGLVSGCTYEAQGELDVGISGTPEDFATYLQPSLGVGCGSLDCHGDVDRPLTLFALHGLRMSVDLRGAPASDAEVAANVLAIAGVDAPQTKTEDHLVLIKPLAVDAGGVGHVGGDVFVDQRDPVYVCLHAWLRAGIADPAGRAVCQALVP